MASPVAATGKRRVRGSTLSGQTEDESQIISRLTEQIEDSNKKISRLESEKLVLEERISEKRAAQPPTTISRLEITKQLLAAFVDKLENAFQYFEFKDYVVANRLLDPLPLLGGPVLDFDNFFKEVAGRQGIRQTFPKLETVDLENALQACLDDRYHYLDLHLQSLPRFLGRPVWGGDEEPSVEEVKNFIEIYPTLTKGMQKDRVDLYVSDNPILQLVHKVRSGQYQLNQNLEVELRMLMKTHSLGKTFDGFNKVVSNPMEESYRKELHDLLYQDAVLEREIYWLQVKVIENQNKIDEIYRMRQLKLDARKDAQFREDPDEMVVKAFNKYKELIKARDVTGERAVRLRGDDV